MEQCLFILLFLTGVIPLILSVPRKYYLIQQGMTWTDAQAYCRAKYTDLAIIQCNDNMVQLQNETQKQQFTSSAWIGLYSDINNWHWSLGNEPVERLSEEEKGESDKKLGEYFCGAIYPLGWVDKNCNNTYPFVCFDDTKTGTVSYIYISNSLTWYDAQAYCRMYHTDLASARDSWENSLIARLISGMTWFGMFRDGWKWADQTNFSTISWMSGKPDNALGNENCGYLINNQAADAQCSDIMPFFCYSEVKKQQIIRVKVQSAWDVNDPAVKAAILEQIKQKLKNHGMAMNIAAKWRVQTDGIVFHKEMENNTAEKQEL